MVETKGCGGIRTWEAVCSASVCYCTVTGCMQPAIMIESVIILAVGELVQTLTLPGKASPLCCFPVSNATSAPSQRPRASPICHWVFSSRTPGALHLAFHLLANTGRGDGIPRMSQWADKGSAASSYSVL